MRRFISTGKDKEIIQLIDIEKMEDWDPHLPIIFINYITDNKLRKYPTSVKKDIQNYLEEIKTKVAIPKLIAAIENKDQKTRKKVAKNLFKLSEKEKEITQIAPTIEFIKKALENEKVKEIKTILQKTMNNWDKHLKKKKNAVTRKKINEIVSQLESLENDWEIGKIADAAYLKKKKDLRKQKIDLETKIL